MGATCLGERLQESVSPCVFLRKNHKASITPANEKADARIPFKQNHHPNSIQWSSSSLFIRLVLFIN